MASRIAAVLALPLLAHAAPWGHHSAASSSYASSTTSASSTYTSLAFPTQVPDSDILLLSNGFPNLDADALDAVNRAAGGTLSNIPAAKNVTNPDSLTNFQLVAFNEFFEVAFFTSLLQNITNNVEGFEIPSDVDIDREFLIETLIAVQAQEELHAINANTKLPTPLLPCAYKFPTTNLKDAIALAATFTDVVMGTLQDVATVFATNDDDGVVRGVASIIGQEGQQSGFYRFFQGKRPSSQPFLTASARDFAFSALNQNFVVSGSCDISNIPLKVFGTLNLLTKNPKPEDQILEFEFDVAEKHVDVEDLAFVLISGQNKPIFVDIERVKKEGSKVRFEVKFPFEEELLFGLTIGALVRKDVPVGNVNQAANAAVFGPALIEVA